MVAGTLFVVLVGAGVTFFIAALGAMWKEHRDHGMLRRKLQEITVTSTAAGRPAQAIFRHSHEQLGEWWKPLQRAMLLEDSAQVLDEAGLDWGPATLVKLTLGSGAACGVIGHLAFGTAAGTLASLAAGIALPSLYVRRVRARRRRLLEEQLPEAIDLLGRAIRAGHALVTGFRLVGEESPEPIATEFRRAFEEQKYGMPFEHSLHALTRRMGLIDVRVMAVAILVQREVGGNLAEILDKLSHLVRSRFALRRQVRVYTAQGRMSGYVLGLMPFGIGGVITLLNPSYLQVLFEDPAGRMMLGTAVCLQVVGYFWMWRILKLDM